MATQRKYGVPASVTIAQAIDESGWGQSTLATRDHNLFGIKGTGPAGSDPLATQEYQNGLLVPSTSSFRVYNNTAESIDDHGKLLATSGYYRTSMADRHDPNAFAQALTGIYATDPSYGTKLIGLMRQYDLYRYDVASPAAKAAPTSPVGTTSPAGATSPAAATSRRGPRAGGGRQPGGGHHSRDARAGANRTGQPAARAHAKRRAGQGQRAGDAKSRAGPGASGPAQAAPGPSAAPTGTVPSAGPQRSAGRGIGRADAVSGAIWPGADRKAVIGANCADAVSKADGGGSGSAYPAGCAATDDAGRASSSCDAIPGGAVPASVVRVDAVRVDAVRVDAVPNIITRRVGGAGPDRGACPAGTVGKAGTGRACGRGPISGTIRTGSAPSAQPSSPPSPVVPGLPVAAATPTGGEAPGQVPASAAQAAAAVPLAATPAALTVYARRRSGPARRRARKTGTGHAYSRPDAITRTCHRRSGTPLSARPGCHCSGRSLSTRMLPATAASAGSCWPPATGCNARRGPGTRRSTARNSAP